MKRKLGAHGELLGGTIGRGRDKQLHRNTEFI